MTNLRARLSAERVVDENVHSAAGLSDQEQIIVVIIIDS